MKSYVVARPSKNKIMCFYTKNELICKTYKDGEWSGEVSLLPDVRGHFTAALGADGSVYIFCQKRDGEVTLCSDANGEWGHAAVLKHKFGADENIFITSVMTDSGMSLIYNAPGIGGRCKIILHGAGENGGWNELENIDECVAIAGAPYKTQHLDEKRAVIFYAREEGVLGCREITAKKIGSFNVIHSPGAQISSSAFLATETSVHSMYSLKTLFSSQVVYRKDFGRRPIVLAEASSPRDCCLFYAGKTLYACFISDSRLFTCVSRDDGASFSRPSASSARFCEKPALAAYISRESRRDFSCRDVYVDSENPSDILLLPDMCGDFFPPREKSTSASENRTHTYDAGLGGELFELRSQNAILKNALDEREKQVKRLMEKTRELKEEIKIQTKDKENVYNSFINMKKKYQEYKKMYEERVQAAQTPPDDLISDD
ncbi:MAG: hypothetical protein LBL35_00230 [Clostridiales bacterium]|jgi:ribosomal protein S15P/S13E|nr:hypothetical protein [Clostridiales bacterium]